jgi:hypothetical protein
MSYYSCSDDSDSDWGINPSMPAGVPAPVKPVMYPIPSNNQNFNNSLYSYQNSSYNNHSYNTYNSFQQPQHVYSTWNQPSSSL